MASSQRILLKLSGESLGKDGIGISVDKLNLLSKRIKKLLKEGHQLAIVCGGGNWLRGEFTKGINRNVADVMGMHATVMNGLALEAALIEQGVSACVMSSFETLGANGWNYRSALEYLKSGKVIIFAGGTGNPFFTTDSAAALRAVQINATLLIKATNVDGIYNKDPNRFDDAVKYDTLSYDEAIEKNLKIMDLTAFSLCRDHVMPILVVNIDGQDSIESIIASEKVGTLVR